MPGRLNIFQRTMLLWNGLHPYNAVHVVRLDSPFDRSRLEAQVNCTLQAQGLVNLALHPDSATFCYEGGEAKCEIKVVPAGGDPHADLAAETERQLNAPFAVHQSFTPFRFFVVPGTNSFFTLELQ